MALGRPDGVDVSERQCDGCGVLVFVAPYKEVARAARLFRKPATLCAGGSFGDDGDELRRLRLELDAVRADRQRLAVECAALQEYVPGLRAERDEALQRAEAAELARDEATRRLLDLERRLRDVATALTGLLQVCSVSVVPAPMGVLRRQDEPKTWLIRSTGARNRGAR